MALSKNNKIDLIETYVYFKSLGFSEKQSTEAATKKFFNKEEATKGLLKLISKNEEVIKEQLKRSFILRHKFNV
jgi:hypothetical protein